jgi:hypothetical protein
MIAKHAVDPFVPNDDAGLLLSLRYNLCGIFVRSSIFRGRVSSRNDSGAAPLGDAQREKSSACREVRQEPKQRDMAP